MASLEAELLHARAAHAAKAREVQLGRDKLDAMQAQLHHLEAHLAAVQQQAAPVPAGLSTEVPSDQWRRVLQIKDDRIRWGLEAVRACLQCLQP